MEHGESDVMYHRRRQKCPDDETRLTKEVAKRVASLNKEHAPAKLVPASAPEVAYRRRAPGGVERGRPLLGIVPKHKDADEGAHVVIRLDEGIYRKRSDYGDDGCT